MTRVRIRYHNHREEQAPFGIVYLDNGYHVGGGSLELGEVDVKMVELIPLGSVQNYRGAFAHGVNAP